MVDDMSIIESGEGLQDLLLMMKIIKMKWIMKVKMI